MDYKEKQKIAKDKVKKKSMCNKLLYDRRKKVLNLSNDEKNALNNKNK